MSAINNKAGQVQGGLSTGSLKPLDSGKQAESKFFHKATDLINRSESCEKFRNTIAALNKGGFKKTK